MAEEKKKKTEAKGAEAKGAKVIDPSSDEIVKLIRKRANFAAGVGLLGIPFVNFAGVTAIQVEMVKSLCAKYDKTFSETAAKNLISGLLTSGGATLASPVVEGVALAVPLVGLPLAIATKPVLNGITTYAMGHVFATHFAAGNSLIGTATDELVKSFSSAFQSARGKMADVIAGKQPEAA
jgi:uncharacterized protein (DUF697 family)